MQSHSGCCEIPLEFTILVWRRAAGGEWLAVEG
jgi:hypothetical protein